MKALSRLFETIGIPFARLHPARRRRDGQSRRAMFVRMTRIGMLVLVIGGHGALAADWFSLADYRDLQKRDIKTLERILNAMQDTVYYAQESVGQPVICASPKLIESATLMTMIDDEIRTPSNPMIRQYGDNDHMAFILMNALKNAKACK